jgi:serine/threonine protein kinase
MGCSYSNVAFLIGRSDDSLNNTDSTCSVRLDWGHLSRLGEANVIVAPYEIRVKNFRTDKEITSSYIQKYRLGEGGFGTCYAYVQSTSQKKFALKILPKVGEEKNQAAVENEIEIHRTLDHEHIVKYQESFEDARNVYMVRFE